LNQHILEIVIAPAKQILKTEVESVRGKARAIYQMMNEIAVVVEISLRKVDVAKVRAAALKVAAVWSAVVLRTIMELRRYYT
jgi:hypothetical protein